MLVVIPSLYLANIPMTQLFLNQSHHTTASITALTRTWPARGIDPNIPGFTRREMSSVV